MKKRFAAFLNLITSIFAALFGIQSKKNMQRDLSQGQLINYIIAGVITVTCLVILMIIVVKLVI